MKDLTYLEKSRDREREKRIYGANGDQHNGIFKVFVAGRSFFCVVSDGGGWDNYRAKVNPYDKAHPNEPPRTYWSDWRRDQAYRCRGGMFYPLKYPETLFDEKCEHYIEFHHEKCVVRHCFGANVQIFQDGYVWCSLVENMGCERCMEHYSTAI